MRNFAFSVFILLLLLCIGQAAYYYPLLPDRVAAHFGASGRPDAWSSKESFVTTYLVVITIMTLLFAGIGFMLKRLPVSLINLPNKDYWLAPERKQETIAFLSTQFLWMGSATLLLLLDIFHQSFMVHLGKTPRLEHVITSLVVCMGFTVILTIRLLARFRRKE